MRTEKHIVFMPSPEHGHINPTLGLASSLISMGHRVTYAVPGRFRQQMTAMGANVIGSNDQMVIEGFNPDNVKSKVAAIDKYLIKNDCIQLYERIMSDAPDLLMYDRYSVSGAYVAMRTSNFPAIKMFPTFADNQLLDLSRLGVVDAGALTEGMKDMSELFQWADFAHEFCFGIAKVNLVFLPKFFQCESSTFDERFEFVGPQVVDRKHYSRWAPPSVGRNRTILVSLGTVLNDQPRLFRTFIEQLSGRGWSIVMSIGTRVDIGSLGEVPADVEIFNFISHPDVLRHADAFIGHGGMGSTMEALYFGVPMILIPQDNHQKVIAQRVMELGLGRVLPGLDNVNLELVLRDLFMDAQLLERVKKKGFEMRKERSVEKALDIVLRHL